MRYIAPTVAAAAVPVVLLEVGIFFLIISLLLGRRLPCYVGLFFYLPRKVAGFSASVAGRDRHIQRSVCLVEFLPTCLFDMSHQESPN